MGFSIKCSKVSLVIHTKVLMLHNRECPPGLSIAQTNRVTGKQPLKNDILLTRKVNLVQVGSSSVYNILYMFFPIGSDMLLFMMAFY